MAFLIINQLLCFIQFNSLECDNYKRGQLYISNNNISDRSINISGVVLSVVDIMWLSLSFFNLIKLSILQEELETCG